MSDETGNGVSVLHSVSGCYAEVHISWENYYNQETQDSFPVSTRTEQRDILRNTVLWG